jgi:transposase-like protein
MDRLADPQTLIEAVTRFADKQVAHDYFVAQRFPNGVACPRYGCGSTDVSAIKNRNAWRCRECNRQFTAKVGTVFEDSPIGFDKWLPAMWLLTNNRNGVSSHELGRALGVTQKTAWFMLHRLRLALKADGGEPLTGEVEADESYIGGRVRRGNVGRQLTHKKGGGHAGKTTVFGMVERGGRVRAFVVPDNKKATLLPRIAQHIAHGATVYTDAYPAYLDLRESYVHHVINHAVAYVEGRVHTNNIENFWSCLKRALTGTYICARPFHLDRYIDEQAYRFNVRAQKDGARFVGGLKGADGRRLTYAALTTSHPLWRLKPGRSKPSPPVRVPPTQV